MRSRRLADLALVASFAVPLVALSSGCAASVCSRVRAEHDAFVRRGAQAGPHVAVAVPFATLSQGVQRSLAAGRPVQVPLPDLGPVELGSLTASLRSVAFREAPPGQVGVRVTVALASGGRPVTALELDVAAAPQLDPGAGVVRVRLRARDLVQVRPSLSPAERRRFAEFLLGLVPASARGLVGREQVEDLADRFLREIVGGRWPQIRDGLLAGTEELVDAEIVLPDLPVARFELRSSAADLEVWAHTSLPAESLAPGPARPPGVDARLVALRMSGGTAAALVNAAMASGEVPARYDREGRPDPRGELVAGAAWRAGERPFKLHAWSLQGTCARLSFGGTPTLAARGGQLEVSVPDGALEEVKGSLKARAGVWFAGLGRQTFAVSQAVASATEFELAAVRYRATVVAAAVTGAELVLSLALAEAPRVSTRPR